MAIDEFLQPKEDQAGIEAGWKNFLSSDENRSALMNFGLQLMQPISPGQSVAGHIGQAIGSGAEAAGRVRQQDIELEEAQAKRRREEEDADLRREDLALRRQLGVGGLELQGRQVDNQGRQIDAGISAQEAETGFKRDELSYKKDSLAATTAAQRATAENQKGQLEATKQGLELDREKHKSTDERDRQRIEIEKDRAKNEKERLSLTDIANKQKEARAKEKARLEEEKFERSLRNDADKRIWEMAKADSEAHNLNPMNMGEPEWRPTDLYKEYKKDPSLLAARQREISDAAVPAPNVRRESLGGPPPRPPGSEQQPQQRESQPPADGAFKGPQFDQRFPSLEEPGIKDNLEFQNAPAPPPTPAPAKPALPKAEKQSKGEPLAEQPTPEAKSTPLAPWRQVMKEPIRNSKGEAIGIYENAAQKAVDAYRTGGTEGRELARSFVREGMKKVSDPEVFKRYMENRGVKLDE